ncbi:MAG: hypothetical protein ACRDRE_23120, partial [Pseudonocardiaceae bacterium]
MSHIWHIQHRLFLQVTMVAVSTRYLHHLRSIPRHYSIMIHAKPLRSAPSRWRLSLCRAVSRLVTSERVGESGRWLRRGRG